MTGTFSAAGHLYGSGPDWNLIFHARDGSIQGMDFDSIDGSLSGSGSRILIPSVVWRYNDGTHRASGMADLDTRQVNLQVVTQHMRLERLLPALGRGDIPLTGWADNTITVTGSLDQPSAQGSFHLTSGSAYGYLYKMSVPIIHCGMALFISPTAILQPMMHLSASPVTWDSI